MKNKSIKPITGEWLRKAQNDEFAVQAIIKENVSYEVACFLAQQVAEKCLKAYLAEHDKRIPKIHQLEKLLGDCKLIAKDFSSLNEEAIVLSEYYIETRYPGDYPEDTTKALALESLAMALKIKDFVYKKLGIL